MTKAEIMGALETKKVGSVIIEFRDDLALPSTSTLYEWKKKADADRKKRYRKKSEKIGKKSENSDSVKMEATVIRECLKKWDTIVESLQTTRKAYRNKTNEKSVRLIRNIDILLNVLDPIDPKLLNPPKPPVSRERVAGMFGAQSYSRDNFDLIQELKEKFKQRAEG